MGTNWGQNGKAPNTLGQIFRYAERTGYHVGEAPTTKIKNPKFDNKRVRFLSLDEAHHLLEILKMMSPQVNHMALVSLHCGLRAGDIFSLTWGAVDMKHGLITLLVTKSGRTRTLSMTERYSHLSPDRNKRAADTLEAIFQKVDTAPAKVINI